MKNTQLEIDERLGFVKQRSNFRFFETNLNWKALRIWAWPARSPKYWTVNVNLFENQRMPVSPARQGSGMNKFQEIDSVAMAI